MFIIGQSAAGANKRTLPKQEPKKQPLPSSVSPLNSNAGSALGSVINPLGITTMTPSNKPEVLVISSYGIPRPLAANVRLEKWESVCHTSLTAKGKLWVTRNYWTDRGDACKRAWKDEVRTGRYDHYTFSTHYTLDAAIKAAETRIRRDEATK